MPHPMPLKLEAYDPTADLRARASRAFQALGKEWRDRPDVPIDREMDTTDRLRKNSYNWRQTQKGKFNAAMRQARLKLGLKETV